MSRPSRSALRVGSVPYLVGRPLDAALADEPGLALEREVPARLVERLRAGSLDVALVSSVELFRRPGYSYLAGPAVVGPGRVSSVQLFLRRPIDALSRVALDPASRTSAALARALFAERGLDPEWLEVPTGSDPRGAAADGWLRIGDRALRESLAADAPPSFNPSAAWRAATGLPFVFALWIARPGVDLAPWAPAFLRAQRLGTGGLHELADEAARRWELPAAATRRYLTSECRYFLGDELTPSLTAFRDLLARHGLADGSLEPRAVPPGEPAEGHRVP